MCIRLSTVSRCLAGLALCGLITAHGFAQAPAHLVELAPIEKRTVQVTRPFVGTVMPSRRAIVGSAVDGRVIEFPVNEGDRVEERQELAQLLTETINLELDAAVAELELREQELGELENGTRPEEKEQARARMQSAQAASKYRELQQKRVQSLYEQGRTVSDQQLDEATSLAQEVTEEYAEARAAYDLAVAGPRPERIAQAKARVAMQSALVDKLRDQIKKHTMISRFAGYVVAEHTEVGQWVSRGDPVAEVIALDEVDVEAKVVEGQVPFIRIGSSITVSIPAAASDLSVLPTQDLSTEARVNASEGRFIGTVVSIVPQADLRSRTFPVKVRVKNLFDSSGQPIIKAGMLAQLALPTRNTQTALLVPKDALVFGKKSSGETRRTIWVVDPRQAQPDTATGGASIAAPTQSFDVLVGIEVDNLIEVIPLSGELSEDLMVATEGNERILPSRSDSPTMVRWAAPVAGQGE